MAKDTKKGAKKKRPTAEKRMIQNKKRRMENRVYRTHMRTYIRKFLESVAAKDSASIQDNMNKAFSALDKSVKVGVIKKNKANRTKSRLAAKAATVSA